MSVQGNFNLEAFTAFMQSRWRDHGHISCHATDHQNVNNIEEVTLCEAYGADAEDMLDGEGDVPPWFVLLHQLHDEGLLYAEDEGGRYMPLDHLLRDILEDEG